MQIFVYEFVTGGGMLTAGSERPAGSLLAEGRAMAAASTADLCRIPGVRVVTTRDERLPPFHPPECQVRLLGEKDQPRKIVAELAAASDWSLLIAPETNGQLHALTSLVADAGGRLLSPAAAVVELASDKQRTIEYLTAHGVPCPAGRILGDHIPPPSELFPAVIKPNDGCGSRGVRKLATPAAMVPWLVENSLAGPARIERFVPGLAASVAVLCGQTQRIPLPACQQLLSADDRFTYLGGQLPLAARLNRRAQRLALAAIETLPDPVGYLGVDLVLGEATDGSQDYAIEINPRLTTSYVALRALCRTNLAEAMLAVAQGEPPALSWRKLALQFTAGGRVFPNRKAQFDGCTS
ncbi:MAG: ATP-grasp domain-containing protein [Pirellulaceae bacterium]